VQRGFFARQRSKYRVATTDSEPGGPIALTDVEGSCCEKTPPSLDNRRHLRPHGQGWSILLPVLDVFTPPRDRVWAMPSNPRCSAGLSVLCACPNPNGDLATLIIHSSGSSVRQRCIPTLITNTVCSLRLSAKSNCSIMPLSKPSGALSNTNWFHQRSPPAPKPAPHLRYIETFITAQNPLQSDTRAPSA